MTREEAIEVYNGLINTKIKEAFEFFAPELRESEDERIRKWIYAYMMACPNDTFEFYAGVGKGRVLEWLEKQKENPKSADSIPSDCVSDVKYEDRWHKVGDSLPDNPREVLCKDEAGNYFIGRYYVGEGWEISNYDDEDKPHHLNPPVSKWIDFPSEKPAEWSEEDEKMLEEIINHIYTTSVQRIPSRPGSDIGKSWIKFLKSLCPHWKPSEEQMLQLGYVAEQNKHNMLGKELMTLYNDLKKLM